MVSKRPHRVRRERLNKGDLVQVIQRDGSRLLARVVSPSSRSRDIFTVEHIGSRKTQGLNMRFEDIGWFRASILDRLAFDV